MSKYSFHEFFAGSGLVSCGLADSFDSVWANDVSARKARVYAANFDSRHFHLGDIAEVGGKTLPGAQLSWASFPCQDLSLAGKIDGILSERSGLVSDIVEKDISFDKDDVIRLVPRRHSEKAIGSGLPYVTGYRRTRGGRQVLELRCDGVAGCLRTPAGGSSRQYLVSTSGGRLHARLVTVREAARLMGAPDSFVLPGTYNDGYFAMGDAVAVPVARYLSERLLKELVEAVYGC